MPSCIAARDNHIRELFLGSSGWGTGDLTAATGAPSASSDPSAYLRGDDISAIVFRTADNHVHELFLTSRWGTGDLSVASGE